ncbi:MAG: HD domain-containing protein [Candidatus Moraniibacteriota bacterium]
MLKQIPSQVLAVVEEIEKAGFEAFFVGGCVRDLLIGKNPKDWDVTTKATPQQIIAIFPDSFYENNFGTVGIKVLPFGEDATLEPKKEHSIVEVTTYRIESAYSDRRRPDEVKFALTLAEDLSRRDFTMNAIALKISNEKMPARIRKSSGEVGNAPCSMLHAPAFEFVDLFGGQKDIKNKLIRAVGDANARFNEDALRIIRAIRFHSQLGFEIETTTLEALQKNAGLISFVANERIKDELTKIILSENPAAGIDLMQKTGVLKVALPELEAGVGIAQNRHHIFTIYQHCLLSLKHCPSKKLEVRLAALFHDIAKPQTKRGEGTFSTFYNHDHLGARIVKKMLSRLKFSNEVIDKVVLLVDNHMFYYNPEEVGEASVRRLIKKVGLGNVKDLIDLRIADRLGSGTPKGKPYKLRHLEYLIEKVSKDAVSVKMLKINGNDLMQDLGLAPGPKIGAILDVLLAEVIEDAQKNQCELLLTRAKDLDSEDLSKLRQMAKEVIEEKKEEDEQEIKGKHWVK